MERRFEYVKDLVVNFKLNWCCWLAPVRIGLIITAYFNIIVAVISLIGTADESFAPIIVQVQNSIFEDNAPKSVPIFAYSTELAFNVVLYCAIYRKDLKLLRVYMMYCIGAIVMSIMFYSVVVAAIGAVVTTLLVFSIIFQTYVIILVRSMIVEMRLEKKKQELPTFVMSTLVQKEKEGTEEKIEERLGKPEPDVEAPEETKQENFDETKPETRLETVDEHPKEEAVIEKQ